MRIRPSAAFFRLFVLVASLVLLTSRLMLLAHEFGGHAAPARLFGGRVTGWYLFLFAGGRVSYRLAGLGVGQRLLVSLGGIAIELVVGAVAFVAARRMRDRAVASFCLLCVGTVLMGHGALYLARGVHYGFGDGAFLSQLLGSARVIVVLAAGALAAAVALVGGRRLAKLPAALLEGAPRRVAGATLLVFAGAGLFHGALALSETRWFPDATWAAVMEDSSVAGARAELARRVSEAKRRGEALPSRDEQERMMEALERARRPWPLDPLLAITVVAALVLGVLRGAQESRASSAAGGVATLLRWRTIGGVAGALVVAMGLILVLRPFGVPH
jgi:hypothetical protein